MEPMATILVNGLPFWRKAGVVTRAVPPFDVAQSLPGLAPMSRRLLALMSVFGVVTALGLAPSLARAQTTTAANISVVTGTQATQLVDSSNNPVTHTFVSDQPFWVNLAECKAGWQYQVSITTVGIGSTTMEVWAGSTSSDCSQGASRFSTSPSCWRVGIFGVNDGTSAVYIPVQRVVGQHYLGLGDVAGNTVPEGNRDDCDRIATGLTQEAGVAINLNFYIFSGGTTNGTPTYSAVWGSAGYDLVGPAPPTTVNLRPADGQIYVSWSQVAVTDLAGYKIYCQDQSGTDAGFVVDAGTTDAGTTVCPDKNTPMTAGCLPPNDMVPSGDVSDKLATSGIAQGLADGHQYACAVASYDTRQNDGVLSDLSFTSPWYVDDFFSIYRKNGGKAGGGFCSINIHRAPYWGTLTLATVAFLVLRKRRRSRR